MTLISALFSMAVVILALGANFMLLWTGKLPMPEETITTITVYGGITSTLTFGGYAALTAIRNTSSNKYGFTESEAKIDDD